MSWICYYTIVNSLLRFFQLADGKSLPKLYYSSLLFYYFQPSSFFLLNFILFLNFIINQIFQPNFTNIYMPSPDMEPSFDQLFDEQF